MVSSETSKTEPWLAAFEQQLETRKDQLYPSSSSLHQACRYALAGQGKRIRPLLLLGAVEAVGGRWHQGQTAALAVEFIHTYSLIHDDLPCMDDDDLRRGRPTTHKVFGEATALLAGDALLTDAFALLAADQGLSPAIGLALIRTLSEAAGGRGMVYGQDLDMYWTKRKGYSAADLDSIHQNKTGALITAAAIMGGIAGGADPLQIDCLRRFGSCLGLCFQVVDDLLDNQISTGKSTGKDQKAGKLTYLSLLSKDAAQQRSVELTEAALNALRDLRPKTHVLEELTLKLLHRSR